MNMQVNVAVTLKLGRTEIERDFDNAMDANLFLARVEEAETALAFGESKQTALKIIGFEP